MNSFQPQSDLYHRITLTAKPFLAACYIVSLLILTYNPGAEKSPTIVAQMHGGWLYNQQHQLLDLLKKLFQLEKLYLSTTNKNKVGFFFCLHMCVCSFVCTVRLSLKSFMFYQNVCNANSHPKLMLV